MDKDLRAVVKMAYVTVIVLSGKPAWASIFVLLHVVYTSLALGPQSLMAFDEVQPLRYISRSADILQPVY